ncbi:MAG: hypothetical protein ACI81R_001908 [Bradymonadia bacterium]|jgi:hypothetical protein
MLAVEHAQADAAPSSRWLPWPSGTDSICDTHVAYCIGGNRWGRPDPDDECDPLLRPKMELTDGQWAWLNARGAFDLYVVRDGVPVACCASKHGGSYRQKTVWFAWCDERQFLRGDIALMREYRGAA